MFQFQDQVGVYTEWASGCSRCFFYTLSFPLLGACPRIGMCRVPSAARADAGRRDAGAVGASPGSANEA